MDQHNQTVDSSDVNADMIYLCSCVVNGVIAEKTRNERMDLLFFIRLLSGIC